MSHRHNYRIVRLAYSRGGIRRNEPVLLRIPKRPEQPARQASVAWQVVSVALFLATATAMAAAYGATL